MSHEPAETLIPYSEPWLTQVEQDAVAQVVASGRLVMGPKVRAFEAGLAALCGRAYAVAVGSGTAALELALRAHGVGPGWDVLVPAYTWVATFNVVLSVGARPLLVDVDPATFCMDARDVERALGHTTPGRRAILPVHLFGYRALAGWFAHEAPSDLLVVGDGCCAFGGVDGGAMCGAWTPTECLSFHPRKVITTGEGGAVLTDDGELAARMARLRDHGAHRSEAQRAQTGAGGPLVPEFPEPGYNMRMTELQGALGVAQLGRVEEIMAGRREAAARYDASLAEAAMGWVIGAPGADDPGRLLTMYVVRVVGKSAAWVEAWMTGCAARGVALRPPMIALDELAFTQGARMGASFEGARALAVRAVGLPFSSKIGAADQARVVAVMAAVGEALGDG
jgi:perosamine synthetase